MYHTTKNIRKHSKKLIAYRSGTGKVAMLASTKREHRGVHFTVIVGKNIDAKLFRIDNINVNL